MTRCDHKFIDSTSCLKCGWSPDLENPLLPLLMQAHIDVEKLTADRDHCRAVLEQAVAVSVRDGAEIIWRKGETASLRLKLEQQTAELAIACGALAEMSRRLADESKAASHWFTEANQEHNRAVKAEDAYVEAHDRLAQLLGHKTETTDGPQN